jgi:hypothetical protein
MRDLHRNNLPITILFMGYRRRSCDFVFRDSKRLPTAMMAIRFVHRRAIAIFQSSTDAGKSASPENLPQNNADRITIGTTPIVRPTESPVVLPHTAVVIRVFAFAESVTKEWTLCRAILTTDRNRHRERVAPTEKPVLDSHPWKTLKEGGDRPPPASKRCRSAEI